MAMTTRGSWSSRDFASLIGRINPSAWDVNPPQWQINLVISGGERYGPLPDPWLKSLDELRTVNGGVPLASRVADAQLGRLITLEQAAHTVNGRASEVLVDQAISVMDDVDELCPRWMIPWHWPGPRPHWLDDEMSPEALVALGTRFVNASSSLQSDSLRERVAMTGERALDIAVQAAR